MGNDISLEFSKDVLADIQRRRYVLLLLTVFAGYLFMWLPWKTSRVSFLIFFGFGMVQTAAIYCQDTGPSRVLDVPPLFMSRVMCLLVMILGFFGFMVELVVGFGAKPWWEALLLPIPPFILSGLFFSGRNPAPSFFVGCAALIVAFLLKVFS